MRRNANAAPSPGRGFGLVVVLCLAVFLATATAALAAPLGVTGFFGNPTAASSPNGAEFSASPNGVAVNDASGDVYVADSANNRIEQFDADGDFIRAFGNDVAGDGNELQSMRVQATGGSLILNFKGQGTAPIGCTAPAATVQTALEAVSTIGAGNVSVSGGPGNNGGNNPYFITFTGTLGHADQPALIASSSCTLGAGPIVTMTILANGFAGPTPDNANEMQAVRVNAAAGQFRLSFGAGGPGVSETPDLPYNATAAAVRSALNALANVAAGGGSVKVSGGPGDNGGTTPYLVDFDGGPLAGTDVAPMAGSSGTTALSGGSGSGANQATVSTFSAGGGAGTGFEICEVAIECKAGAAAATGGGMGSPQGIAINQVSGDLYVSDQALQRIDQFDAAGNFIRAWGRRVVVSGPGDNPAANAVQQLTVKASGGKLTLEFQGQKTGDLAFNAGAATIQAALSGLTTIGAGNVEVSGGPGDEAGTTPYTITFKGTLAETPLPDLVTASAAGDPLNGGAASATVATTTQGSNEFEICTAAALCQRGFAGGTGGAFANTIGYPTVAPVGAPNQSHVLVAEPGTQRVEEFTAAGAFVRAFGWDVVAAGPSNTGVQFEICRAAAFDVCKAGVPGTPSTAVGSFSGGTPTRIAEDTSGAIYTVESAANFRVQRFTPAGANLIPALFCPSIGGAETLCGTSTANTPTDVAVDPTDNHVYVVKAFETGKGTPPAASPERRVLELDSTGALVETHIAGSGVNSVNGMALKSGGAPIYLSASSPKPGINILGEPTPPHPTIAASTAITTTAATLHGTVNPNGGGPLHTFYRFEYRAVGDVSWIKVPASDIDVGSGETAEAVSQAISGLQPNRNYEVRLVATKGGAPVISTGNAGDFKTDPAAPVAETFAAFWDTSSEELVLRGGVNPNNTATSYYFEYGTQPCESSTCATTAVKAAGAGGQLAIVSQRVEGLSANTTYHYRVVADNGIGGEIRGEEGTLTTPSSEPCANEQFRTGASEGLAECRAYERVSDGESWGSGINGALRAIADDGNRAQFNAQAFGEPESLPGPSTPFVAERTGSGWAVPSPSPEPALAYGSPEADPGEGEPEPDAASGSLGGSYYMVSEDLGTTLWPEASVSERLRGEVRWTLVDLDESRRAASEKLVPVTHGEKDATGSEYALWGSTPDLSHFAFTYSAPQIGAGITLFAGEPLATNTSSNLYEIAGADGTSPGTLRLVNRGATPTPTNPLGTIGGSCGAGLGGKVKGPAIAYRAMSRDGSVIHFSAEPTAPAEGACSPGSGKRLYKRLSGATTVAVSAPACSPTPTCPGSPGGDDDYQGASTDGEVALFTTPRRLTNSDADSTSDLYLYDSTPPGGQPALVQASAGETVGGHTTGSGAEVLGMFDTSADGSRVYFVAKGELSAANGRGEAPSAGQPNLYVYERDAAHPSGRIDFVATLGGGDSSEWGSVVSRASFALPASGTEGDGHVLLFLSVTPLLGEDTDSSRDLYRYQDESGELGCLTCMGEGPFGVKTAIRPLVRSDATAAQGMRPASADLGSVVFTTAESLVDDDLNGANDVYLWRQGALSLISAGAGELGNKASDSEQEVGISPDGKNVFFITRAGLVADDTNNGLDLYDARIGGGFAVAAQKPICESGDSCQGPGGEVPAASSPGSAAANGPGNPTPAKPCKKGKVRKHGKCVKKPTHGKKHKQKKKTHKKRAGHERGGKR